MAICALALIFGAASLLRNIPAKYNVDEAN